MPDESGKECSESIHSVSVDSRRLLFILIAGDLAFFGIHLFARGFPDIVESTMFLLSRERGYAESYQYIKWFWVSLLLLWQFGSNRKLTYLMLSGIFLYLLLDDSMQFHERAGLWLSDRLSLGPFAGLRGRDIGEVVFLGAVGAMVVLAVGLVFLRASGPERWVTFVFLTLFGMLGFFGIAADLLHGLLGDAGAMGTLLEIIEDGGEMIVASAAVWTAYDAESVWKHRPKWAWLRALSGRRATGRARSAARLH